MRDRIDYIDAIKGFGIILVIFGHTYGMTQSVYNIIYSFHMPLFFIVSGFLYNEEKYNKYSFKQILFKKAKDYLIPYYIFATINLVLVIIWSRFILQTPLKLGQIKHYIIGILYCNSNMKNMPNCSPIWFLMCLFVSGIMFWAVLKYIKKMSCLIALISMGISYALSLIMEKPLPWKISTAFMGMFFIYIGYAIKKYNLLHFSVNTSILGVIGIVISVNNSMGMNENNYDNFPLCIMAAITISYSILMLFKKVEFLKNPLLLYFGKNSLIIVGFNYFLRDLATEVYYLIPGLRSYKMSWFSNFTLTMLLGVGMIWIWNKGKDLLWAKACGNKRD